MAVSLGSNARTTTDRDLICLSSRLHYSSACVLARDVPSAEDRGLYLSSRDVIRLRPVINAKARRTMDDNSTQLAVDPVAGRPAGAGEFTMPALACSQALRLHPRMAHIRKRTEAWTASKLSGTTREEKEQVLQWRVPLLASACAAGLEEDHCQLIAQFFTWLVLMEDIAQDTALEFSRSPEAVKNFNHALLRYLLGGSGGQPPASPPALPAYAAYRHQRAVAVVGWWHQMRSLMSPSHHARFVASLRCSLASFELQAGSCRLPDLQSYILRRRSVSTMLCYMTLLESFLGMDPEEPLLECDLLQQLRDATVDHVNWVNDLFAFKGDYSRGDYNNLLALIWKSDPSCNGELAKSVEKAAAMIRSRDEAFTVLLREASKSRAIMEVRGMAKLLQCMGDAMAGNLHWSYATSRYFGRPHATHLPIQVQFDAHTSTHEAAISLSTLGLRDYIASNLVQTSPFDITL